MATLMGSWANGQGSTRQWRNTRQGVLERDGAVFDKDRMISPARCRLRLDGCEDIRAGKPTADQVHHTVGREVSGDDPNYLVSACQSCNLKAGNPVGQDPEPQPVTEW